MWYQFSISSFLLHPPFRLHLFHLTFVISFIIISSDLWKIIFFSINLAMWTIKVFSFFLFKLFLYDFVHFLCSLILNFYDSFKFPSISSARTHQNINNVHVCGIHTERLCLIRWVGWCHWELDWSSASKPKQLWQHEALRASATI